MPDDQARPPGNPPSRGSGTSGSGGSGQVPGAPGQRPQPNSREPFNSMPQDPRNNPRTDPRDDPRSAFYNVARGAGPERDPRRPQGDPRRAPRPPATGERGDGGGGGRQGDGGGRYAAPSGPAAGGLAARATSDRFDDEYDVDQVIRQSMGPQLPWYQELLQDRRVKRGLIILALVLVLLMVGSFVRGLFYPSGGQGAEVTVNVAEGATFHSLIPVLEKEGVANSGLALKVWSKVSDPPAVQQGEYVFRKNSSPSQVFATFNKGPKLKTDRLTVPEGKTIKEIAELVGAVPGMNREKFLEVVNSGTVRSEFQPTGVTNLEGFLFPDTYFLYPADDETSIVKRMVSQFDSKARAMGFGNSQKTIARSTYDTLIIASLIESEGKFSHDRSKISQVVENRLAQKMPLQFDASLVYGLGTGTTPLTRRQLDTDHPYNLNTRQGLPPSPISNPGEESMKAALNPTPGPWLFFVVVKTDGTTAFSVTYEEHKRNIEIGKQNGVVM